MLEGAGRGGWNLSPHQRQNIKGNKDLIKTNGQVGELEGRTIKKKGKIGSSIVPPGGTGLKWLPPGGLNYNGSLKEG